MRELRKSAGLAAYLLGAASLGVLSLGTSQSMAAGEATMAQPAKKPAKLYKGKSVRVGHGKARVVVGVDAAGKPVSVGVLLSTGALDGLPTELNKKSEDGAWVFTLPMPTKAPKTTGYSEVVIDWNPHGHPPEHIYTVPHFDFHFYTISPKEVDKVHFSGPNDSAAEVSDQGLVPPHYKVIPETAINRMGVHAVNMDAPEFKGTPFTATFIYGYYKNRLTFLEPMVTRDFLKTGPKFSEPVETPAHYSSPGYYPTRFSVRYDAKLKGYLIRLGDLKHATGGS